MSMAEMEKAIGSIRLLLASIKSKESELEATSRQFKRQLSRAPNFAIHGGNSVESALAIMSEIQERLDGVERTRRHLETIREKAEDELQALTLTNRIEAAKGELETLKARYANGQPGHDAVEEIAELERFIEQARLQAAQAISDKPPRRLQG